MLKIITLFILALFISINCNASSFKKIQRKVRVGKLTRTYTAFIPRKIKKTKRYKLVIGFHPAKATSKYMESTMKFHSIAGSNDFVFAYPDGYKKHWNGKNCCGPAHDEKINDIGFTTALIRSLKKEVRIKSKVFLTGFSNGAVFSYHLSCLYPNLIAGVAVFGSTTKALENCKEGTHPYLFLHGNKDKISFPGFNSNWIKNTFNAIGKKNKCKLLSREKFYNNNLKTECVRFKSCSDETQMCIISDLGHSWPGSSSSINIFKPDRTDLNANAAVMNFFKSINL